MANVGVVMSQEDCSAKLKQDFSRKRAAEAVVDAALICREERGEQPVSWQTRQALVEAIQRNPLLTLQLFQASSLHH